MLIDITIQHYYKFYIIAFEDFINVKSFLSIFTKFKAFTRKQCCLHRPIEYVFSFDDGSISFFGKAPITIDLKMQISEHYLVTGESTSYAKTYIE